MNFASTIAIALLLSGPMVILIGIGRSVLFLYRAVRSNQRGAAWMTLLPFLGFIALLAMMLAVWFGYGVAHSNKDLTTDAAILAGTLLPAYLSVFLAWRLYRGLEDKWSSKPNS